MTHDAVRHEDGEGTAAALDRRFKDLEAALDRRFKEWATMTPLNLIGLYCLSSRQDGHRAEHGIIRGVVDGGGHNPRCLIEYFGSTSSMLMVDLSSMTASGYAHDTSERWRFFESFEQMKQWQAEHPPRKYPVSKRQRQDGGADDLIGD
jgi:hypothetical protein